MSGMIFRYLILLYIVLAAESQEDCPSKCICKRNTQRDGPGPDWVKLRCGDKEKIHSLEELDILNIASEIVQLNLSKNHLSVFLPKIQLIALQKLDLSRNELTVLQNNQFIEVPNLRRLDISWNNIKHIEPLAFANLQHLERLKLNQNQITTIGKGTFKPFNALKQLDISSNPLTCDCELLWLLDWSLKTSVKLVASPKCNAPETFEGLSLRKLKVGVDIHCKSPAGNRKLPVIDLHPLQNQVVFEGDTLKMECSAPSIIDIHDGLDSQSLPLLQWTWLDSNPQHHFHDISIDNRIVPEKGFIHTSLTIARLERNHTGIWNCLLVSNQGNHSKGITVVVISDDTQYCPIETTTNNKGSYTWPRTVVNYTVTLPCESMRLNSEVTEQKASYFCAPEGHWERLNTSSCQYISDTTKILEQFSKVNLSLTRANIFESAKHFKNQTSDLKIFKDVMDLVFTVRTIENYLGYLYEKDLGTVLMEITNNLMELPAAFIGEANEEDGSCSKIVRAVETVAGYAQATVFHKQNVATEQFRVKRDAFTGMTCSWYSNKLNSLERKLLCVSNTRSGSLSMKDEEVLESSIVLPASLFQQLEDQEVVLPHNTQYIVVTMFKNNKFFPVDENRRKQEDVTSNVAGVKLMNMTVTNLTDPVYVMLKSPPTSLQDTSRPTPVWWDPSKNNGRGAWSKDGCKINNEVQDNLVFSCKHLGYYGLMQNVTFLNNIVTVAKFRFSHPAIYAGGFILITILLIAIMTYLLSYNSIQMPKKAKHSLINTWISISLLCFIYMFGIYQVENVKLCQSIGLILHYLTLCSLLWMCVGVNYMYKRLTKNDTIGLQDDELPSDQPIQKPILGLYLVGWGIALIICGISGAVNMKEYASSRYCFLNSGPAMSALFIPFTILIAFLLIFFLLIRCAIYNVDTNGHLSEGTQATENVDLDLLEPNFPNVDSRSVKSDSTKTASSEVEDPEHAPAAQLKAYMLFLFIYILTWLSCAFATVQPFKPFLFKEDIFSIAFAIFATILGIFTLFFYCFARNDVRTQWMMVRRGFKQKNAFFRTRNVSDTSPNVTQIQIHQAINNPIQEIHQITSRSSSRSSSHTKTNSHTSNILKAAVDLNGSVYSDVCGAKINNVNLVVLHRQQYRLPHIVPNLIENPTNTAEMFYNPHQSTVARKFFKKQKRHMMKRNNLAPNIPREVNSDNASVLSCPKPLKSNSSIDRSIFGTNSKVNNTNIHVEHVRKSKHRNPNILSDSCEEYEAMNNIPVEKLVMNAERLRKRDMLKYRTKKKQNVPSKESVVGENNMRSVSQQCTLEYSSETISDSILDKMSPDKSVAPVSDFKMDNADALRRENSPALTEDSHYCKISSAPDKNGIYYTNKRASGKIDNYESWGVDSTTSSQSVPRIYVNPSHDLLFAKSVQSRTSSVSASELDELYQQIRRGPMSRHSHSQEHLNKRSARDRSPCLSDSEINTYVSDIKYRRRAAGSDDNVSDKVETTV